MQISVIIPTYNRAPVLKKCLEALVKQTFQDFEIIVVDDGSNDQTKETVFGFQKETPIPLHYFYQANQKQGAARNLGIKQSQGNVILFLGDDIFALPKLIETHFDLHQTFPEKNIAVLGHTTWDPFLKINAYMRFLEWSGWQFNYPKIEKLPAFKSFREYKQHSHAGKFLPPKQQHWFFYTSNLSLKKELLLEENFDEKFKTYGWEDIELGKRLTQKKKLHLFYAVEAYAHHHHLQTELEFENKIKNLAKALQFAPSLRPAPWKIWIFRLVLPILKIIPFSYNWKMWINGKNIFYQSL